jgi:hypothetical protein
VAEKISFKVDFGEAASFVPYEGLGSSALLKQDGFYMATINKVVPGKSKESGNPKFIFSLTVQDEDEKGQTVIGEALAGGKDKNGAPLSRQLWEVFFSMGMTQQQVQALAANGLQDAEAVATTLTGKTVFLNVEAETYNGNTSSRVRGFIAKQRYEDAKAANAHRKAHKAATSFSGPPAGTQATGGIQLPTGGVPNGAAKAADPLSRLSGLNLPV